MSDISAWSTTAASNNAASPNGFPESMAPSGVNDSAREVMASVREWYEDAQWANWGHTPTRVDDNTFTVATDLTAVYQVGRRLKLTGSATGYCTISASSYSAPNTTVDVTMDSGNIPGTLSAVYVSIVTATSNGLPTMAATNLTGTLADARLSSNVPLKNAANIFTAGQAITGTGGIGLTVNNTAGTVSSFFLADATVGYFGTSTNDDLQVYTNNTHRGTIAAAGNWTINAASSGDELTVAGSVVATTFTGALTGNVTGNVTGDITGLGTLSDASTVNSIQIGYRHVPQNAQTGNYTCVLADSGKHIYHASGAGSGDTYTIPANASVAYPIGTALTFINSATDSVDIAITSDTLTHAGTTDTGTRTLAQNGVATAIKVTSTSWLISGSGLT